MCSEAAALCSGRPHCGEESGEKSGASPQPSPGDTACSGCCSTSSSGWDGWCRSRAAGEKRRLLTPVGDDSASVARPVPLRATARLLDLRAQRGPLRSTKGRHTAPRASPRELTTRPHFGTGRQGGWQMPRMGHDSRKEILPGVRSHRRNVLQLSASTRGFENLSTDYHDKAQRRAIDTRLRPPTRPPPPPPVRYPSPRPLAHLPPSLAHPSATFHPALLPVQPQPPVAATTRATPSQVFGVWRSEAGRHHRIDIIVNSFPEARPSAATPYTRGCNPLYSRLQPSARLLEAATPCTQELPFTLLGWTGSRLLNRMMRQRAKELGLYLSSHALIATPPTEHGSTATWTTVIADGRRLQVHSLTEVPYEYIRSEEDIMRILAGGTDEFRGLYEPMNRNA